MTEPSSEGELESRQERFLRLLEPNWGQLARYSHALAKDYEAARDLLSETIAIAWEHLDDLRDEFAFKRYLFRIAVRLQTRARRVGARHVPIDDVLRERLTTNDGAIERSVEVSLLYQAMDSLPKKQREALMLFEISGLTIEEIRAIQGGSISGVKTRLSRGREALSRSLGIHPPKQRVTEPHTTERAQTPTTRRSEKASSKTTSFLSIPLKAKL